MAKYSPDKIRNVALVGQADAGKTTLAERLLHLAGVTQRIGTVAEHSTISDFAADEHERQQSIDASVLHYTQDGVLVNLLDTPGAADFIGDALAAMAAVDTAVLCIPATRGLAVTTRRMWREAVNRKQPRMFAITKIEGENVDLDQLLRTLRATFGDAVAPLTWPDQVGPQMSRVYDLIHGVADGLPAHIAALREALLERIVIPDERLTERYLEGDTIAVEELVAALPRAIATQELVPVVCCSPVSGAGIPELAKAIIECLPAPAMAGARSGHAPGEPTKVIEVVADPQAPFAAQVFAVKTDDYVGRFSYIRVISGTIQKDGWVINPVDGNKPEKVGTLLLIQGKEHNDLEEATAGMIVGVSKVEHTAVGSTLCSAEHPVVLPPIWMPRPMVSLALTLKSRNDESKIGNALKRLCDEKPTFRAARNEQTRELVASATSDLQLKLMLDRLRRRFHIDVETHAPRIAYLESISRTAKADYRHKKQSGGRGQFGEVHIEVEPLERGKEFEFEDAIVGGVISRQYIPAVEKGIRAQMEQGVVAGYRLVDVKVRLFDGKEHAVDSSEDAFKRAGGEAFKLAIAAASPVLLEPVLTVTITVPNEKMGEITSDLNSRRGRILGMESRGDFQILQAEVPEAELLTYSTELRSMTGGEGFYATEFARYDAVPTHKADEIIKAAMRAAEDEKK